MAHEKVVRRSMSMSQWARLMFEQVEHLTLADSAVTQDWRVRMGQYAPEAYTWDGPETAIADGELWGRPDGAAVFHGRAVIPQSMAGKKVWLHMNVAAEVIVHINGKMADGLDPNRKRIVLCENAKPGTAYELMLEAYSRSKPDDERNASTRQIRGCVQQFNIPRMVVVNEEAVAVAHDLQILYEAAFNETIGEDVRQRLERSVREVCKLMPPFESSDAQLAASLPRVGQYLAENVYNGAGPFGQTGKLACVAHSHLDVAYHWRVVQSVQKNARTCLIQLRLMDRHPEFLYAHSQSWCYETLEKHYPQLFKEVQQRVAEGRWEIVGGLYVEPDCNVISAESLSRQIMYAKRYFLEKFGREIDNCWLPDVFGNSAIMPQILKAGGIDYFVSNKMSTWNDTNRFPHNNFMWKGIDGSEIAACVPPVHFITWMAPDQVVSSWESFQDKDVVDESLHMYGYGDGGSGATDEMIEHYRRLLKLPGMPQLRMTTGQEYLHSAFGDTSKLGTWDGELYLEMHRGTFTTKGALKLANRQGEFQAFETEALCTMAALAGASYPLDQITSAWKKLLVNQFHDIIPGSHTAAVAVDALDDYAAMRGEFDSAAGAALDALAPAAGADQLAVFNPFSFARDSMAVVDAPIGDATAGVDASGASYPLQQQAVAGGDHRVVVKTGPVAPLAMKNLKLVKSQPVWASGCSASASTLESPFFTLRFDDAGSLVSIFDKKRSRETLPAGQAGNQWQLFEDRPGMYNAWDLLDRYEDHPISIDGWAKIEVVEQGPISAAIRLTRQFSASKAQQVIRVWADIPRVDFETYVDWRETERLLKVAFPTAVHAKHYETDTSAGVMERPNHRNTPWEEARFEVCCHKWVRLGEGLFGVSLVNDSKYGCDVKGNVMRLSLLRAPIRPDRESDKGEHRFTYSIFTDGGDWRRDGLVEAAYDLNWPMAARLGRAALAPGQSILTIDTPSLHVQAVKLAEDGSGDVIVRLIELYGSHGSASVQPSFAAKAAGLCDLLERQTQPATLKDGAVKLNYRPYELMTLRFKR